MHVCTYMNGNGMCCREKYASADLINDNKDCSFAADVLDTCSIGIKR